MAMQDPATYGKIGLLTTAIVSFMIHNALWFPLGFLLTARFVD